MTLDERYKDDPGLLEFYTTNLLEPEWAGELTPYEVTYIRSALKKFPDSTTLKAMTHPIIHPTRGKRRTIPKVAAKDAWLKVNGCTHNNLKDIDVRIPIGRLPVISGVSGCGKSSFMRGTLAPAAKDNKKNYIWKCLRT